MWRSTLRVKWIKREVKILIEMDMGKGFVEEI
jgi:hypothetical protein